MEKWHLCLSCRPNQLRSCPSMVGTATWGCRGFTYQRKLPLLAGCFLSPRATRSTVDSTMSPCKEHVHHVMRHFFASLLNHNLSFSLKHCFLSIFCSHIRWGSPPVINPVDSLFPNATLWSSSLSLILPVTSQSSTTFNLSNPAPGDWFVAAHLPEDDGRIEQKVCVEWGCTIYSIVSTCSTRLGGLFLK